MKHPAHNAFRAFAASLALVLALPGPAALAQTPTETRLTRSPDSTTFGQSLTLTALVDALGQPPATGSVSFRNDGVQIGVAALSAMGIGVADVGAGSTHSCALANSGRVFCWGSGSNGRLGNGATDDSPVPVLVSGITNAVAISAGSSHSCAVLGSGAVQCWGSGGSGRLGNGNTDSSSVPVLVSGISDAVAVSAGNSHTCAVLGSGAVQCWGAGNLGQLGNGNTDSSSVPVPVSGITDAAAVSAGGAHSCAVLGTGAVQCWGFGGLGRLGNGDTDNSPVPVPVSGITNAVGVSAASDHSCAVLGTGLARCWGSGGSGRLGNGATDDSSVPVPVSGITNAVAISAGTVHSCAVLGTGAVRCWGNGDFGRLGNGDTDNQSEPVPVGDITDAVAVSAGSQHNCAVLGTGTVQCWGRNSDGRLGNGATAGSPAPVTVSGLGNVAALAVGISHSCVRLGTNELRCWGSGHNGRLGLGSGSTQSSRIPVAVIGIDTAEDLSAGREHSCAVLGSGAVECWGGGNFGQLGFGSFISFSATPVTVTATDMGDATAVAAGDFHSCAINQAEEVWCWGRGENGRLGNGSVSDQSEPVRAGTITGAKGISAGNDVSCAIAGGEIWCWGSGADGRLGNGDDEDEWEPVTVSGITNPAAVSVGRNHVCAVVNAGEVRCWGNNGKGQLGDGTFENRSTPVHVTTLAGQAVSISAGDEHSCAVLSTGAVQCWGDHRYDMFGEGGPTANSAVPVTIAGITNAVAVGVGQRHSCVLLATNDVQCWGRNNDGRLALPSFQVPELVPVDVVDLTLRTAAAAQLTTAALPAGTRSLTAVYAGSDSHAGSTSVAVAHVVSPASQTISFTQPPGQSFGSGPVSLSATASSGLPVAFASQTSTVCSVSGSTVTLLAAGTCTIRATQAGDANFNAAPAVDRSFEIAKASQTITFTAPPTQTYAPGATVEVSATASSGLLVAFASLNSGVCSVSGSTVTLLATGTCTIRASQGGNANWNAAPNVDRSFEVNSEDQPADDVIFRSRFQMLPQPQVGQM